MRASISVFAAFAASAMLAWPVRTFVSMSFSGFAPASTDAQRGSWG